MLSESRPTKMSSHHFPALPAPFRHEFGSDPKPELTEPAHPVSMDRPRQYVDFARPVAHEPLPSVSQLLTSGAHSSLSTSPYSNRLHSKSPTDRRPRQPSPYRSVGAVEPSTRSDPQYFLGSGPRLASPYGSQGKENALVASARHQPLHPTHHPRNGSDPLPQGRQAETSHPTFHPQPAGHLRTPASWHHGHSSNSGSSASPASLSPQLSREGPGATAKPLPRVISESDIPGEGRCYVYEDGTHCKKIIDGEVVNAQWGVTKAGKPRKRLAIACTTCREKKIKCDPADPKCVQCDKSGRECHFQNA